MKTYYLLWAIGPDKHGIVASLTKHLFLHKCNLEDSSMMRLGNEFGIFIIFTSDATHANGIGKSLTNLKSNFSLEVGFKKIPKQLASFKPNNSNQTFLISAHGMDHPGIVYSLTDVLSRNKFNITDLQTHRTSTGNKPGYIVLIEGETSSASSLNKISSALKRLEKKLKLKLTIRPISQNPL